LIVERVEHHVPVGLPGGPKFFGSGPACAAVKVRKIAVSARELSDFPVLKIPDRAAHERGCATREVLLFWQNSDGIRLGYSNSLDCWVFS
jgi:hypothetical protein